METRVRWKEVSVHEHAGKAATNVVISWEARDL
jgi:hypothetical protein